MKTFFKSVALSTTVIASSFLLLNSTANAMYGVTIQVNDRLVSFPDSQPFIDAHSSTQVPIRFIAEHMESEVSYSSTGKVTLTNDNQTITLQTGSTYAKINGETVKLSATPKIVDDRTFVPLRFVSETLGYPVSWSRERRTAIISQDGKSHDAIAPKISLSSKIVNTAKSYIGVKYRYGGTTPNGFDCSGFVDYVFNQHGIDLPHSSQSMHNNSGYEVDRDELMPGDLVFFITNKVSTSHVGIYIGNNEFISAASSGVEIDSLSSSYWNPKYNGAKRIF